MVKFLLLRCQYARRRAPKGLKRNVNNRYAWRFSWLVATSLQAAFNQQVLSPGHYALMPYMLEGEKTLSEIFIENAGLTGFLLESGEEDGVVDGEFIEAD